MQATKKPIGTFQPIGHTDIERQSFAVATIEPAYFGHQGRDVDGYNYFADATYLRFEPAESKSLLDILARELKVWPGQYYQIFQDSGGNLHGSLSDGDLEDCDQEDLPGDPVTIACDRNNAVVDRADWQAAVDALKAAEGIADAEAGNLISLDDVKDKWLDKSASIKWPDGAEFMGSGVDYVFYRNVKPSTYDRWSHARGKWATFAGEPAYIPLIPRPTERAVEWDGVGNPPVGVDIECTFDGWGYWRKGRVLCYGKQMIFMEQDGESPDDRKFEGSMNPEGIKFRPIRTQEQIAADEREKAIKEMVDLYCNAGVTASEGFAAVYDAGYRKQVAE